MKKLARAGGARRLGSGVPPSSTSTGKILGADQPGRVKGSRHGDRIVDEGAVEAVVAGVELHVEAEGVAT